MSFPFSSSPYDEPFDELPGLPEQHGGHTSVPLPTRRVLPTAIAAPSAPGLSMSGLSPGGSLKPDWATILSLVLPAVIAAMKGGGAAPLGAFYQSFGQASREGEAQKMEQEERLRKEREVKTEQVLQKRRAAFQLEGQSRRELADAETAADFRRLKGQLIRAYHEA